MTDALNNAGGSTQTSATIGQSKQVSVNEQTGAQDDTEEMYPFELMPVGDPHPQSE